MVVDLQGVARGAHLDGMIAGGLKALLEVGRRFVVGGNVERLLGGVAAIDQPLDRLTGALLMAEVLQGGLKFYGATDHGHGIQCAKSAHGQVLGRRLSEVDHDQGGGLGQGLALAEELGPGRFAQVRRPGVALQVGKEVDLDLMIGQPGVFAAGPLDQPRDGGDGGRQIGAGMDQFEVVDLFAHGRRVDSRRAHDHPRRRGHQNQREDVPLRTLLDDLGGQGLGPVEEGSLSGAIGHGIGAVDDQDAMGLPAAAQRQPGALQNRRLDDSQHHQHDQQRPQHQQQHLLQLQPPGLTLHRGQQIFHGRPGHLPIRAAVPQVDEDGRSRSQQPAEGQQAGQCEGKKRQQHSFQGPGAGDRGPGMRRPIGHSPKASSNPQSLIPNPFIAATPGKWTTRFRAIDRSAPARSRCGACGRLASAAAGND